MKNILSIIVAAIFAQYGHAFIVTPGVVGRPSCNTLARRGVEPLCAATKEKAVSTEQETMKKTQIVAEMAEKTGLNKTQSEAALVAFLETISDALGAGSKVNLPGFGSFEARFRAGRQGRNPRTGEPLMIEDTHVPAFTAAKALKDSVKASNADK